MARVLALGEVMVEVGLGESGQASIGYAGDTFNTAVYLRRLGCEAAYATALGADDPFSEGVLKLMEEEGVDAALISRLEGRLPGLYAIQRDPKGERRFFYWRGESAARDLFSVADLEALGEAMDSVELVYVSGISLAVAGEAGRSKLYGLLQRAKAVALDVNYRPKLWADPDEARGAVEAAAAHCRFISTSAEDLAPMGLAKAPELWAAAGAEVVERCEDRSLTIRAAGAPPVLIPPGPPVEAVDTTGAGDSFNAAYLATRLAGQAPEAAAAAGRRLAETVIQHRGAIIPKSAMPA